MILRKRQLRKKLRSFVTRYSFLMIWVLANVFVFAFTFNKYKNEPQYYYLRQILGYGLCISRSSGTVINISCALLLLPVCRCFTTVVRHWNHRLSLSFVRSVVDRCKAVHISCAYTMIAASVGHTVAHVVNAVNFCRHFSLDYPDLNLAKFSGQNPVVALFLTVPGFSGIFMLAIIFVVLVTSMKRVRIKRYNVFWYCHQLIVVFLILLICHPLSGILKEQVNLSAHPPGCIYVDSIVPDVKNESWCYSRPQFLSQESQTWKWMVVPVLIYSGDFLLRRIHRSEIAVVLNVTRLPASVVELVLKRNDVVVKPGQFVILNCPSVSSLEWHPFSVSSCGKESFSVHMRIRGDWSSRFCKLVSQRSSNYYQLTSNPIPLRLYVDGPFGSPFEDILLGPISICIAGAIGITPFASILQALLTDDKKYRRLKSLHLVWLCRNSHSFLWFSELLCRLHFKLWNLNRPDLLQIQLYLTGSQNYLNVKEVFGERHLLLIPRLGIGRPDWKQVFSEWSYLYKKKVVNVFCCGPATLNRQIRAMCMLSSHGSNGTTFTCTHESFS